MHVEKTSDNPTKIHLIINAGSEDLEPIKKHVLGHFKNKVKVPGFRPGKAPIAIVEKHVDQKALLDEFLEHAINELYRKAITEEKLRPVSSPQVQMKKFVPFSDLTFESDVEVIGEIKLANYKTIKLPKKPVTISAKDVEDVIVTLRRRSAERIEVTRAAKNGDEVIINFSGNDTEGKPIPGTEGKDYPLTLGSNILIPGFEEHLIGVKAGESKEFPIIFPKDYGVVVLQNKKVTFKVAVEKVQELKQPKLDSEFVSKVGPFKTVAELKADIKKQLAVEQQNEADQQYGNELIQKIVEKSSVEIPEVLIEEQAERLEQEEKRNLIQRGQTWQEHLKEEGVTEEEHKKRHRPDAELRVKAGLILSEVADLEQLTVQSEELKIHIDALKGQYKDPAMRAELDKPENQQDIAARLLTDKTVFKLVEYASK